MNDRELQVIKTAITEAAKPRPENWCFRVRMKGEHGEVELSQSLNDPSNGPAVRDKVIAAAQEMYKGLKDASTTG